MSSSRPKVAVIGTGIAGMSAAWFLRERFDVTFYEKNAVPGGHTNTVTLEEDGRAVPVDTGFMVYNEITYPLLTRFFKELGVPTKPTSMSFSVQHLPSALEYSGTGLDGLFAQRRNLLNPRFLRMLGDIDRFNRESPEVLEGDRWAGATIAEYAETKGFGRDFLDRYLVPMSSAVWSTEPGAMRRFPAVTLVRFFRNHGLLGGLSGHYTWRTVEGGSRVYRDKVLALFPGRVLLGNAACRVARGSGLAVVEGSDGRAGVYHHAVIACHADEALALLGTEATELERRLLSRFRYQRNAALLHGDASVMPKKKRAWSSWNYRIRTDGAGRESAATVYSMNSLQRVSEKKDYFVSINDPGDVDPSKAYWKADYDHPTYDGEAVGAQKELPRLNEGRVLAFCGSYFGYGFHEDAFRSGLEAARAVAGERFWP
ncbi:MAG TPA: FAD-dependent oxidoreductase [Candidatus Eisenbacteria bacterium]|nr:FAD-dependent oxidoreductase [Candidatus Eisenbacteria bacterium]